MKKKLRKSLKKQEQATPPSRHGIWGRPFPPLHSGPSKGHESATQEGTEGRHKDGNTKLTQNK